MYNLYQQNAHWKACWVQRGRLVTEPGGGMGTQVKTLSCLLSHTEEVPNGSLCSDRGAML